MRTTKIIAIVIFFSISNLLLSQAKSNLEIIHSLIENNVSQLLIKLPHEVSPFQFEYLSPDEYESLENRYIYHLSPKGLLTNDSSAAKVKFSLDEISISYSEPFRNGLLGDFKIERNVKLNGTFNFGDKDKIYHSDMIESVYSDTLFYSDLDLVEAQTLAITHGTKPDEPLFESLLEPVIAVGAVIVTIILLFTVRSK